MTAAVFSFAFDASTASGASQPIRRANRHSWRVTRATSLGTAAPGNGRLARKYSTADER
jgi:hypothetical protein